MGPKTHPYLFRAIGALWVLLFFLLGCNNPSSPVSTQSRSLPGLNLEKSHSGKKDSLLFSGSYTFRNTLLGIGLYASADSTLIENYSRKNGAWIKTGVFRIKNIGKILHSERYSIRDSFYLSLISLNTRKEPSNTLYFSLFDPLKSRLYSIRYRYFQNYSNLSPKYQIEDSLRSHFKILRSLEKISAKYALDADPKSRDNAIVDSLTKRWVMLNDRVYDETANPGGTFQLNNEEYIADLAPGLKNYENNDSLFKKNVSLSENGQYKIESLLNGPVFGYNKNQKKGFILWVPDQPDHYIRTVALRGNHVLFYDSLLAPKSKLKPRYDYDLGLKIIKKLK
jgi:hypothetical protein